MGREGSPDVMIGENRPATKQFDGHVIADGRQIQKGGIAMKVNGMSGVGAGNAPAGAMGMNQASDPVSKDLLRQIDEAKKKLQELSSNEDMSMEEKMKKRQELQKQISDLNSQLRQHQMEMRREASEKAQKKDPNGEDQSGGVQRAENKGRNQQAGMSKGSMQAMIGAEGTLKQAKIQGSVAKRMEGRAGVLEAEIKLDAARGGSVEAKEEELAQVKEKAQNATDSQLDTLSKANGEMKKAGEIDQETGKTQKDEEEKKDTGTADEKEKDWKKPEPDEKERQEEMKFVRYAPVDVRL